MDLKFMNKKLIYVLFIILSLGISISHATESDKYFYIHKSELHSLKESAINGDQKSAYKLARYYDYASNDINNLYKASLWYYISGLLGQKNGFRKALEILNLVTPTKNKKFISFFDFLKLFPREKFYVEKDYPKLSGLLLFLYYDNYCKDSNKYCEVKKSLLNNGINTELFSVKKNEIYLHDDFYLEPKEIQYLEVLALRGNLRATIELLNFSTIYPSSYNKYSPLWYYIYNKYINKDTVNIHNLVSKNISNKYNIHNINDIFLLLGKELINKKNDNILSYYILYKYYTIMGDYKLIEKYKIILKKEKIDNRLI